MDPTFFPKMLPDARRKESIHMILSTWFQWKKSSEVRGISPWSSTFQAFPPVG